MISEKQVEANQNNAQNSTGPLNTALTRFNAVKYGLSSECFFTENEEEIINNIREELSLIFKPENPLKHYLVGRMAIYIWRTQKATNIEKLKFANSLKIAKNKRIEDEVFKLSLVDESKLQKTTLAEQIDLEIDLILRYETANENRLLKLIRFYKSMETH